MRLCSAEEVFGTGLRSLVHACDRISRVLKPYVTSEIIACQYLSSELVAFQYQV